MIKRRTLRRRDNPNDTTMSHLVGAVLLEQDKHWQLEDRQRVTAESMAEITTLDQVPATPSLQEDTA